MGQVRREDVPIEETWDLTPIFKDDTEWEIAFQQVAKEVEMRTVKKPYTYETTSELHETLLSFNDLLEKISHVSSYAMYKYSEDGTDPENQNRMGRSQGVSGKFNRIKVKLLNGLAQVDHTTIDQFLEENEELDEFSPFLQRIKNMREHTLSTELEEAISSLSSTLSAAESVFLTVTSTDLKFDPAEDKDGNKIPITLHRYMTQVETSPDTVLRRSAYESLSKGLANYQNGLAKTLATEIEKNVALAKLRGYPSALHMLLQNPTPLSGFFATDGMTPEQFGEIIDTFRLGLSPIMQKYARLRKEQLGLETLKFSDIKAPLDPSFDPPMTYEEAGEIITAAVAPLGTEYQAEMQRVFDERWVYRANNQGSRMIPFGGGVHGVHGYSFYPWGGNMFDVLLLGHELGHALHFSLSGQTQKIINNTQSLIFVEAPSTLTEHLIVDHLKNTSTDDKLQRWLNMYLMMSYHHNCVTHILEAELLRRLYAWAEAGKPLTTTVISDIKGSILEEFWGDTVEIDEGAKLTWMRQPHYYMGIYPFTYSVGMSASTLIAKRIKEEGAEYAERWTDVLKAGGSKNGFELFEMMGIDMTTTENLSEAVNYVGDIVEGLIESFDGKLRK